MYGPCGVKRKFDEVEGMETDTYMEQRQSILDISMYKLRTVPARRTEPSLRRSVLIYNTLRVIEHELRREGVAPSPVPPSLFPPLQEAAVDEMTLDPLPGAEMTALRQECQLPPQALPQPPPPTTTTSTTTTAPPPPPPVTVAGATPLSLAASMEALSTHGELPRPPFCPPLPCSIDAPATPAPPPPPSADAEEPESEPEPIIHTLQPVTNSKLSSPTADALLNSERLAATAAVASTTTTSLYYDLDSRLPVLPVPSLPNGCAMSHLTAASQRQHGQVDIFGDIDLTLYDFDLLSSFSSNVKMAPLSAEELMHSFPADSPPPSLSSPSPCYRNELLNDDLDHIMQVLVGI